ncbi:MAG: hypothetical protein IKK50_01430 [Ruminiclostridium sp.]|nr:hypothetical protein [Ruminiclostridium sp.]
MKKGTIIGIVIGLLIALVIGGVIGVMAMRIYMLEDELTEQTTVQEQTQPQEVEKPAVQQPAAPQPQQPQQPQTQESQNPGVDVETEVSRIRAIYNDTVANMDRWSVVVEQEGINLYYNEWDLKCVIVPRGAWGVDYSRYYYYENQELIFAYYEAKDAHRFYFYEGELMRWRYSPNAQDAQNATNYDWANTAEYNQWETIVRNEGNAFVY